MECDVYRLHDVKEANLIKLSLTASFNSIFSIAKFKYFFALALSFAIVA